MVTTPNLVITHIDQSQAAKEDTFNTGLDKLDGAIAGFLAKAVTDGADTVLTDAEALENMVFSFTGTLTDDRNVEFPDNNKIYVCQNNTTGGFSITLKTNTGAGVVLTSGGLAIFGVDDTPDVVQLTDVSGDAPYDMGFFFGGLPVAGALLSKFVFDRNVDFPSGLTGSEGHSRVAATAQTDFDIQKNSVSIGTCRFAAAASTATFIMAGAQSFVATDRLEIVAPNPQDATLEDVSITLNGDKA